MCFHPPRFVYVPTMTHPPTTREWSLSDSLDSPNRLADSIHSAVVASSLLPSNHKYGVSVPYAPSLFDQSGRLLGTRARRTRARILEATVSLLEEKSLRDLRVIDIARAIGSSPATFYQYFKDVTDIVLELSTEVSDYTPEMIEMIHGDWTGSAGHERGVRLVNLVTDYWDRYKAILRVRNNAADEGDPAFREVRLKAMLPMVTAFAEVIKASHDNAKEAKERAKAEGLEDSKDIAVGGRTLPLSGAMLLFTALESMAIHHEIFEQRFSPMGEGREALVESLATMLQSTLTAKC